VRFAVLAERGHPAFDVVHAVFAQAHVAGRRFDHLIRDLQIAQQALGIGEQARVPAAETSGSSSQMTYCSTFRN
jgi:hypothetical protein